MNCWALLPDNPPWDSSHVLASSKSSSSGISIMITLRQCLYDILEFLFIGSAEVNSHAETIYQRQLLLYGITGVHILSGLLLVTVVLADEMAAVGSSIDQDVLRLFLQTTLDDSL